MSTITINIPDREIEALHSFIKERGGFVVNSKEIGVYEQQELDEDEVTHSEFFGENIRRAINILNKR